MFSRISIVILIADVMFVFVMSKKEPHLNHIYLLPTSKEELNYDRGTLFVIVLDARQIVIASDSRTTTAGGPTPTHKDGVEKVIQLDRNLAFLSAGVDRIYDRDGKSSIELGDIALNVFRSQVRTNMVLLANIFGKKVDQELSKLPEAEIVNLYRVSKQLGQENLFQSMFAGLDGDGKLKLVTVVFRFFTQTEGDSIRGQLKWKVDPPDVSTNEQIVFFVGQSQALRSAFDDPKSAVARLASFQKWLASYKQNKILDPILTSEALVDLGIKYLPEEQRHGVGYPIFVYRIDATNGFNKVKTVPQRKAGNLPN